MSVLCNSSIVGLLIEDHNVLESDYWGLFVLFRYHLWYFAISEVLEERRNTLFYMTVSLPVISKGSG